MASITFPSFRPYDVFVAQDGVEIEARRVMKALGPPVTHVPVIRWRSGSLWDVANIYLSQRIELVLGDELKFATVKREADHLCAFASFLEASGLEWYSFGVEREKKPTYAFRGSLLRARRAKALAPSTATARMGVVIRFYKWVLSQGLIADGTPPFERRDHVIHLRDKVGFAQSMVVASTNLAIKNRQVSRSLRLEGGLRPVSSDTRNAILSLARTVSSPEFALQLAVGFLTGARLQTILSLKVQTLRQALPAEGPSARYLLVGPGATPPVDTKFGITGRILVPTLLLEELLSYATSERRLIRVAKASAGEKDLLFLNRFGRAYEQSKVNGSRSVNKDMARLKREASLRGINLSGFYFHCSRSTFATQVATIGLARREIPPIAVIRRVKDLLLHRSEVDAQRYIDYVHESKVQLAVEEEFSDWLFGKKAAQTK